MAKEEAMKRSHQRSKTISVLAILVYFSVPSHGLVADFFPLDVWEEMDVWEQKIDTNHGFKVESSKLSNKLFPFNVSEELNNMGEIQLLNFKNFGQHNIKYGTKKEDKTNPYWMPEEYRTP